jgi:DNA-binding transcriptional MocR family regulator
MTTEWPTAALDDVIRATSRWPYCSIIPAHAYDSGELQPGEKLPPTRALAAEAHINHLTAVRVYRRLAELGYVSAAVGRGTFVRRNVPAAPGAEPRGAIDDDWQLGMLAPRTLSYADEMLRDSLHAPHASDTIALGSGFPDPELCPSAELAQIAADIARETPRAVTGYLEVEGLPRLRERLAELGRDAGVYATIRYRRRRDALLDALERHLRHDATWTIPTGGHNTWLTLDDPVDERALYVEALREGVSFLPGGAIQAEKSARTSMRLSFGLAEPKLHDEAVRRLAVALRAVRRRGRSSATGALS